MNNPLEKTLGIFFPFSDIKKRVALKIFELVKKGEYDVTSECVTKVSELCKVNSRTVREVQYKLVEFKLIEKDGDYHTAKMVLGKNVFSEEWNSFLKNE